MTIILEQKFCKTERNINRYAEIYFPLPLVKGVDFVLPPYRPYRRIQNPPIPQIPMPGV